jgi:hypothetical protein
VNAVLLKHCSSSIEFPLVCLFERFLMGLVVVLLSPLIVDLNMKIQENEYTDEERRIHHSECSTNEMDEIIFPRSLK